MLVFLFGRGAKARNVSISRMLYDQQKAANELYPIKDKLAPGKGRIYTAFEAHEPFLTYVALNKKEAAAAAKLVAERTLTPDQANELILSKKTGTPLYISQKQTWLAEVAKKAGFKTEFYR